MDILKMSRAMSIGIGQKMRKVAGRTQVEKGQRRKRRAAKEKPGKPTNQEELERNQEKMALHSPDPKFIPGDSEQGRVPSDNGISL